MFKCLVERRPCFCSLEVMCDHGRMFCILGEIVVIVSILYPQLFDQDEVVCVRNFLMSHVCRGVLSEIRSL